MPSLLSYTDNITTTKRKMRSPIILLCSALVSSVYAADVIDPNTFESIWQQNNQHNLIKRYHERNETINLDQLSSWYLDIDSAPNKTITTSAGDYDAIFSRMGIHYQSPQWLFLIDWLSVIPQPQTAEGFFYGDSVIAYTWHQTDSPDHLTLGINNRTIPRSTEVGGQTVFNYTSNASQDDISVFFQLNISGINLGTYYSNDNGVDNTSLYLPIFRTDRHTLSSTLIRHPTVTTTSDSHTQFELDYRFQHRDHLLQTVAGYQQNDVIENGLNQLYLNYRTKLGHSLYLITGLYYRQDLLLDKTTQGEKLGLEIPVGSFDIDGSNIVFGIYYRRNAYGDFKAMVLEDEPIFSFNMHAYLPH